MVDKGENYANNESHDCGPLDDLAAEENRNSEFDIEHKVDPENQC